MSAVPGESSIIMYLAVSGGADMCVVSGEAGGETETAAERGDVEPGGGADTWFHLMNRSTGQHEAGELTPTNPMWDKE